MIKCDPDADLRAAILLRRYERTRRELMRLESLVSKAAADYGLRRGYRGFAPHHMSRALEHQGLKKGEGQ